MNPSKFSDTLKNVIENSKMRGTTDGEKQRSFLHYEMFVKKLMIYNCWYIFTEKYVYVIVYCCTVGNVCGRTQAGDKR